MSIKNNKTSMMIPLLIVGIIALIGKGSTDDVLQSKASAVGLAVDSEAVSVMTYNVENLFDTVDDPGKNDESYLPLDQKNKPAHIKKCNKLSNKKWRDICLYLDWSKPVLHQKMSQLARSIKSVGDGGPDILILQEVENKNILTHFVTKYLDKKYQTIELIEGQDVRGIDVAVVSRLASVSSSLSPILFEDMDLEKKKDTRGILHVGLELPSGRILGVYANHFPAPYHSYRYRIQAFKFLNDLLKKGDAQFTIAAGDFNVPLDENQKHKMLEKYVDPVWQVAHQQCNGCQGTYYYPPKKQWSFLDMILLSKNIEIQNVKVIQEPWMLTQKGYPKSFSHRSGEGASDHFPLYAEIVIP